MQISNGVNKIIVIVAGAVMAVVLAVFLVWPKYQKLQGLNSNVENKKAELQSQEAYFSQIKEASAKLQEYPDALLKISDALPTNSSLVPLVNFLQINSAQTGLILEKIVLGGTTAPSENKGTFTETQLIIHVSGSYNAFKDFLTLIENSARMIEVQNISIEIPPEKSEKSPVFILNLKTFSY